MLAFLACFILWLLFNGRLTADVVVCGLVLSAAVAFFADRICGWTDRRMRNCLKIAGLFILYLFRLFYEIIKANLDVMKVILTPGKTNYDPRIFRFDSQLDVKGLETVLANSITITPGTYTISTDGRDLTVHGLNDAFARVELGSDLNNRLIAMQRRLEGSLRGDASEESADGKVGDFLQGKEKAGGRDSGSGKKGEKE